MNCQVYSNWIHFIWNKWLVYQHDIKYFVRLQNEIIGHLKLSILKLTWNRVITHLPQGNISQSVNFTKRSYSCRKYSIFFKEILIYSIFVYNKQHTVRNFALWLVAHHLCEHINIYVYTETRLPATRQKHSAHYVICP